LIVSHYRIRSPACQSPSQLSPYALGRQSGVSRNRFPLRGRACWSRNKLLIPRHGLPLAGMRGVHGPGDQKSQRTQPHSDDRQHNRQPQHRPDRQWKSRQRGSPTPSACRRDWAFGRRCRSVRARGFARPPRPHRRPGPSRSSA